MKIMSKKNTLIADCFAFVLLFLLGLIAFFGPIAAFVIWPSGPFELSMLFYGLFTVGLMGLILMGFGVLGFYFRIKQFGAKTFKEFYKSKTWLQIITVNFMTYFSLSALVLIILILIDIKDQLKEESVGKILFISSLILATGVSIVMDIRYIKKKGMQDE